jgi:glyoxylase-like metal-dependent hydrolase (beta-lactamase superfamily II)
VESFLKNIVDPWFTVQGLDSKTFAISEYGHWEKVHSFLLLGETRAALIDTGLGIDSIKRITDQLTDLPIIVLTTHVHAAYWLIMKRFMFMVMMPIG